MPSLPPGALRRLPTALLPFHLWQVLLVFKFTFHHVEAKKGPNKATSFVYHELELVYLPMLQLEHASAAQAHYAGFRAALQARYDHVGDAPLWNMLTFLARRAGNPMMLSLLALMFHADATIAEGRSLPRGNADMFESAVDEYLAYRLGEEEAHNAHGLLFFLADTLRSSDCHVSPDDVEKKLKAISKGRNELNTWRKLFAPPDPAAETPATPPPLIKLREVEGRSCIQFCMPAVNYVFQLESARAAVAPPP